MGVGARENLQQMTKETFEIQTDHDNRRFITQVVKEFDKNHNENHFEQSNEARIYANPGNYTNNLLTDNKHETEFLTKTDQRKSLLTQNLLFFTESEICPVKLFELYISKLHPEVDYLWQRPKQKIVEPSGPWYDASPVGRDPLNSAMKNISESAKLSQIYTNHCIRATVVTKLNEKGFEARDIMATTGHKSECSIRSYATKCPTTKRRQISDALASPLLDTPERKVPKIVLPLQEQNINTLQNINETVQEPVFEINDGFDDDIPNEEILKVLTQIENENRELTTSNCTTNETPVSTELVQKQDNSKTINVSNVSTVANVNRYPLMPHMYFPNSNVTINYNFSK